MKTKVVLSLIFVAILSVTTAFGQSKTEKFKVYGNCGMCEKTICRLSDYIRLQPNNGALLGFDLIIGDISTIYNEIGNNI